MLKKVTLLLVLTCLLYGSALAHPGRTDSNGGHWNRSTGTYHYHDGNSSSSSSSSYSYNKSTPLPWQDTSKATEKSQEAKLSNRKWGAGLIGVSLYLFIWLYLPVKESIKKRKDEKIRQKEYLQQLELEKQKKEEEKRAEIKELTTHSLRELSGMPDFAEIGEDGLPKEKGKVGWGEYFTRYSYSYDGMAYHKKTCHLAVSEFNIASPGNARCPCGVCKPEKIPDLSWYKKYKTLQAKCKQYGINAKEDE